jgi:hypothetical protein
LDSSIIQGPFSVAPCQTLISRFATFASPWTGPCWTQIEALSPCVVRPAAHAAPPAMAMFMLHLATPLPAASPRCAVVFDQVRLCRYRFFATGDLGYRGTKGAVGLGHRSTL